MTKPLFPSAPLSPNYGEEWDDLQDERLRDCASGGLSRKEAGLLLGRTETAIKGRAQALGLRFLRDTYGGLVRPYDIQLPQENRNRLEDSNHRLLFALAKAISRGEHLSKGASDAPAA